MILYFIIIDEKMNLFSELWVTIFEFLDCASVLNIKLICKNFNKICENYNLYIKHKFRNFPRQEGQCCIYNTMENNDIVRGDIIHINDNNIYIFDGHLFIKINKIFPKKFKILDDNIPINYWANNKSKFGFIYWINLSNIHQQCIDNIYTSDIIRDIRTSFTFNNQEIKILYYHVYRGEDGKVKTLKSIFETNNLLPISFQGKGINDEIYLHLENVK